MTAPLMIAVAPNGARKNQLDHPALPIASDELAETALQCLEAGACMIHTHVRDHQGGHSLDVDRYRAATVAIRQRVGQDMIIQATTEAVGIYSVEEQIQTVRLLKPEAVSLAIREFCPEGGDELKAAGFFAWLLNERVMPQYILYSAADVKRFDDLRQRGIIPGDRVAVLYVLGRYSETGHSSPTELIPMLTAARSDVVWSVCAFGASEAACGLVAAGLGGHCRVGFENNLQLIGGETAPDNRALVAQVSSSAHLMARVVASSHEARILLSQE